MSDHYANIFDVSKYQAFYIQHGAALESGFVGGIFRSSGGTLADGTFKYNTDRMKAVGGLNGAYHFFYSHRPIVKQVNVWWDQIEPYWPLPLKTWFDVECRSNERGKYSPARIESLILEADLRFQQLAGTTWDGIYTSASAWKAVVGDELGGADSWLLGCAHYTTRPEPFIAAPWRLKRKTWWWWQFTERGRVSWYRNGNYNIDLGRVRETDLENGEYPPDPCEEDVIPIELRVPADRVDLTVSELPIDEVISV